jgi:hypothetical protein
MCRKSTLGLACMVLLLASMLIGAIMVYADSSGSIVSGRLGATYDIKTGNVTAIVVGYCQGKAVTVGPVTWPATQEQFSNLRTEDVARIVCGKDFTLQKVTKSDNSGKEIVADVLIVKLNQ